MRVRIDRVVREVCLPTRSTGHSNPAALGHLCPDWVRCGIRNWDRVDIEVSKAQDTGEFLRGLVAFLGRGGVTGKACLPGFDQLASDPVSLAAGNNL